MQASRRERTFSFASQIKPNSLQDTTTTEKETTHEKENQIEQKTQLDMVSRHLPNGFNFLCQKIRVRGLALFVKKSVTRADVLDFSVGVQPSIVNLSVLIGECFTHIFAVSADV